MERLRQLRREQISEALKKLGLSIPLEYLFNSDLKPKSFTDKDCYAARAAVLCRLEKKSEGPDYRIKVPEGWRFLVSDSEEIVISKYGWQMWEEKAREFLEEIKSS